MRPGDLLEQRYRLVRVLGRGRSGTVWCARNELIDRAVAVKVLHRSLASDPERLQRFFQEARACGRVRHPAVVEVLDLGQGDDGILFLVMELLEGETMASLLARKGHLSVDEALALVIPLAHGLAAAHAHGILHRDLKPANIYLHKTPTGGLQPKILDFGISKIIGTDVTATGVVLGTPSYMSPEQARGVPDLDPRTDVWSLGVILYELIAGRLPFIAKEYRALVDEIIERKHVPVDQVGHDVPREVSALIDEALEKSRDRRLASASAMAQKLTAILRARGKIELLREPEDEFSEGAPTLTQDRAKLVPKAAIPIQDADETVGDANPLPIVMAPPQPAQPTHTRSGVGPTQPSPIVSMPMPKGGPSPFTALLAAQTSGAKRIENTPLPRPAAGAPARPSLAAGRPDVTLAEESRTKNHEETRPDPLPLARRAQGPRPESVPKPEPASRPATTQSWELSVGLAASGRAEVLLGASESRSSMRVNEDWDTTVADVSATSMEKGPLPKAAPAPPQATDYPPAAIPLVKQPAVRHAVEQPRTKREEPFLPTIGAIPGFTAAAPAPTSVTPPVAPMAVPLTTLPSGAMTSPLPRKSTPPPMRRSTPPPPIVQAAADFPKRPPKPPPRTVPPPSGSQHKPTLRPPAEGFAVPGPTPSELPREARPSMRARESMPPPAGSPLIAPELYALGDDRVDAQPFELTQQAPANQPESQPEIAVASSRGGDAPALSTSIPADSNVETDRHRAAGPSIVPLMVAAVTILFFFGALIGTVAASSRSSEQHVRHLATATGVLVAFHAQAIEDDESSKLEDQKKKDEAVALEKKKQDDEAKAAAAQKEADDKAAAEAAASASASASTSAEKPAKAAPKWAPPPKTTKPVKAATPAPKKTADPAPAKKKDQSGDWWKKKF